MTWLLGLILLVLIAFSAHIQYKWRGEEREWQGPFNEDEWPDEELPPASPVQVFWTTLYYCVALAYLGLFAYLLRLLADEARRLGVE